MKIIAFIISCVLVLVIISCNRLKKKGKDLGHKTELKIKNKSKDLVDKVIPSFDAYHPDTKYNKKRFHEFLKVKLTSDIINIYCFDDAVGIDADYMFSFNCNEKTANRIIDKHNLTLDKITTDYGFGLQHDFKWWDKEKIAKLDLYSWNDEKQYFKYFWFDKKEKKAYFFDFDM